MSGLSSQARAFINTFQGGFPLVERPYSLAAEEIGMDEAGLLHLIGDLLQSGVLSRFGPLYDASRLGGAHTLAAMAVPESRFEAVAEQVNALPEVAHNYRREHPLNMWFVVATPTRSAVGETLDRITRGTGLVVHDFPKRHEFYIGLWLHLDEYGRVDTVPVPPTPRTAPVSLDQLDRRIIALTQGGLPLVPEPAAALAGELGIEPAELLARLQHMLDAGVIRRVGAVPNHYRLGLRGNGMTVWDLPDESAVALGERVGALDFVSHAYLRPRHPGVWRYNLFAMVHGEGRDEVLDKSARIRGLLGDDCRGYDILFSSRILKKTGLRIAA